MSEILRGVLNMPPELWSGDAIDVAQRHSVYKSAWREIDRLTRERDEAIKSRDLARTAVANAIQHSNTIARERDEARKVARMCVYAAEEYERYPWLKDEPCNP